MIFSTHANEFPPLPPRYTRYHYTAARANTRRHRTRRIDVIIERRIISFIITTPTPTHTGADYRYGRDTAIRQLENQYRQRLIMLMSRLETAETAMPRRFDAISLPLAAGPRPHAIDGELMTSHLLPAQSPAQTAHQPRRYHTRADITLPGSFEFHLYR
jgi:hypothetical protein